MSNLVLLCRRHHRAVHEEGYQVERGADDALQFRCPNGQPLPDVPPPAAVPPDPIQVLRATHTANGLHLHATTLRASWLGEKLDVGWAIDVLHPLAAAPRCEISPDAHRGRAARIWAEHHRGSRVAFLGDPIAPEDFSD